MLCQLVPYYPFVMQTFDDIKKKRLSRSEQFHLGDALPSILPCVGETLPHIKLSISPHVLKIP